MHLRNGLIGACAALFLGVGAAHAQLTPASIDSYKLSVVEMKEIRKMLERDKYFDTVNKRLKNIDSMMKLLSRLPSGPAKLVLRWNRGTWNGFAAGIKGIEKISNYYTCITIAEAAAGYAGVGESNLDFWNDLYVFRNCP